MNTAQTAAVTVELTASGTVVEPQPYRDPGRFYHFRFREPVPNSVGRLISGITAYVRPSKSSPKLVLVAFAECDARDPFNRRVGRTIARRKWMVDQQQAGQFAEHGCIEADDASWDSVAEVAADVVAAMPTAEFTAALIQKTPSRRKSEKV